MHTSKLQLAYSAVGPGRELGTSPQGQLPVLRLVIHCGKPLELDHVRGTFVRAATLGRHVC